MKSLTVAKCPECSTRIPFWTHVSFNQFIGVECPACACVLTHGNYTFLIKIGLLVLFVYSMSRLVDGNVSAQWIMLCLGSIVLLVALQVSFRFLVRYKPD
jgi:hypothetical protein